MSTIQERTVIPSLNVKVRVERDREYERTLSDGSNLFGDPCAS
jgi:hypothetical protein